MLKILRQDVINARRNGRIRGSISFPVGNLKDPLLAIPPASQQEGFLRRIGKIGACFVESHCRNPAGPVGAQCDRNGQTTGVYPVRDFTELPYRDHEIEKPNAFLAIFGKSFSETANERIRTSSEDEPSVVFDGLDPILSGSSRLSIRVVCDCMKRSCDRCRSKCYRQDESVAKRTGDRVPPLLRPDSLPGSFQPEDRGDASSGYDATQA